MTNKEKIDSLLSDISELKGLVEGIREMEICPLAFFSQAFDLGYKILRDLHILEGLQIDVFQTQMDEYKKVLEATLLLQETSWADAAEPAAIPELLSELPANAQPDEKPSLSLNDALEKKKLSDFRKAFSLNDRFYFRKELFAGDEAKMNKVIADLNEIHSYEESLQYLNEKQNWDAENTTVATFLKLLEKRFR